MGNAIPKAKLVSPARKIAGSAQDVAMEAVRHVKTVPAALATAVFALFAKTTSVKAPTKPA